jgi:hypothetical protein
MRFAKVVFLIAGVWGFLVLTPLYFFFDAIARQHPSLAGDPEFFYGFLAVGLAWQLAFLLIGSDPARYRIMMIPAVFEKLGYVLTLAILFMNGRIGAADTWPIVPDFLLGILFITAFLKTSRAGAANSSLAAASARREDGGDRRQTTTPRTRSI